MLQIAFYRGRTQFFDRMIQWWMRGPYSHCELVLDTKIVKGSQSSLCLSASRRDGGVRCKWIDLSSGHWDLVDVEGSRVVALEWLSKHKHAKYDYLGLFGFIFRRIGPERSRFLCSSAVAAMLGFDAGWRFDPNALYTAVYRDRRRVRPK